MKHFVKRREAPHVVARRAAGANGALFELQRPSMRDARGWHARRNSERSRKGASMLVVALALALLIGLSLGLFGGGGSILTVPILRYVIGMDAHAAIGLSLLVVGLTSLAALVPHAIAGRVRFRTGFVFGLAGMAGAYGAGRFAHYIPAPVLLSLFALMMLATAIAMLRRRAGRAAPGDETAQEVPPELPITKVLLEGVAVGAVTGLVGAGGGFLVVPALVLLGNLPMELAVGTSLVVIAMKSLAGFAGYASTTQIDLAVGLAMSTAAVAGSVAGGALVTLIKPARLRVGFGWLVVAMSLFVLAQELPPLLGWHAPVGQAARSAARRVVPNVPSVTPAAHTVR